MDAYSRLKITPADHENHGVHVCHKCGWPFPNPHPSAKHRRAHKRICGTVEGYKLTGSKEHTHLTVSDDEQDHPSDEDSRTPSPKIDKRSSTGSGGVGGRSSRSEDEVFSDAVTEFSDSGCSPGIEEPLEGVKELDKNVQRTVEGDRGGFQLLKVDAIADSTEPLSSPPENRGVGHPEVLDNATATIMPFQDYRTEEAAVAVSSLNDSPCDLYPVKSETPADVPRDILNANIGDNGRQYLTTCLMQETDVKPNKDEVDEFLMDAEEPQSKTVSKAYEQETDLMKEIDEKSSQYVPANDFVESVPCESVERNMCAHDLSPVPEHVEHKEASVNNVQIKADLVQDMDASTCDDLFEISDTNRETEETMHVLSVASDLPIVDRADIMLTGFKDNRTLKSDFPIILGSADVTRPLEDDKKVMVYEESTFSLHSSKPDEIHSSSTDFGCEKSLPDLSHSSEPVEHMEASVNTIQIKADPIQDMDSGTDGDLIEICDTNKELEETMHVLSVASDLPIVEHADILLEDFKDHRTFKSNSPPVLGSADVIRPLEGDNKGMVIEESPFRLHSSKPGGIHSTSADMNGTEDAYNLKQGSKEDLLTTEGPDEGVADTSKFNVTSGEALESNGLEAPPSSSRSEKENITNGSESREGVTIKESSVNANTNFVYEDSHQTTELTGGDDRERGKAAIEISDVAWSEKSAEGAAAEGNPLTTTTITKLEPGLELSDSGYLASIPDTTISDINTSVSSNMMPTHPSSKNLSDNDSREVRIEPEMNRETEVVAKCFGRGIMGSKLSQDGDFEELEENLEKPIMKEPGPFPIHSEISGGSSSDVKDGQSRNDGKGNFGVISQPMQGSDDKLIKQPGGVSSVYLSVDSSTDSVEGNWGSVSVLSAQSDAPAYTSTEILPKSDPGEAGKSENTNLHLKTASENQDSDKAGLLEPPSFMTLVEPRGRVDKKAAVSEIETVQGTQQPNSEALQAGWFPSLTNVVNESAGRKKNEDIISKVTNWSTGKHQSIPLKNLLGEAKVGTKPKSPETIIQRVETAGKSNGASGTTVKEVLGSEAAADQVVKRETAEEWNSPARYPVEIKKEKRKVKGKPSWVPFVCCSSVN